MSRQTFELLILGCSSATPTAKRNPTAQLLNIAERFFLIDCGEATQIQLRRFKTKFQKIDHIFISHLHGDHFLGLPGLLASMHLLGRKQSLTIYGPPELELILSTVHKYSDTHLNYPITFVHTTDKEKVLLFEDEKVEVYSFPLKHRIPCTGFLFKEKPVLRNIDKYQMEKYNVSLSEIYKLKQGANVLNENGELILNHLLTVDPPLPRSYAFCSDTIYDEELVKYIKNVTLLYHESTFLHAMLKRAQDTYHTTALQAAQMAQSANVKQLILGHYSARYPKTEDFLTEASPVFANTLLAIEGKKINVE